MRFLLVLALRNLSRYRRRTLITAGAGLSGASWNIFQDFTMSLFAFVAAGESNDLFHPNRSGGAVVQTTFSLVY